MKITHALSVIILMSFFIYGAHAEEYKAPQIKWQQNRVIPSPQVAQEKEFNEFDENGWRVQEDPYKERNVASEEEPEGRNPSSEQDHNFAPIPSPRPWKYQP